MGTFASTKAGANAGGSRGASAGVRAIGRRERGKTIARGGGAGARSYRPLPPALGAIARRQGGEREAAALARRGGSAGGEREARGGRESLTAS
jgi:hypothetical protein